MVHAAQGAMAATLRSIPPAYGRYLKHSGRIMSKHKVLMHVGEARERSDEPKACVSGAPLCFGLIFGFV